MSIFIALYSGKKKLARQLSRARSEKSTKNSEASALTTLANMANKVNNIIYLQGQL